jgi:hypothetical protein
MSKFIQSDFAQTIIRRRATIAITLIAVLSILLLIFSALRPTTIVIATTYNISAPPTEAPQATPAPTAQPTQAPAAVAHTNIKAEEPVTKTEVFNLVEMAPKGTTISEGDNFPGGLTFTSINGANGLNKLISVIERHGEKVISFLAQDGTDSSDSGTTTVTFDRPVKVLQFNCYDNDPKAGERGWTVTINGKVFACKKQTENRQNEWLDINVDGVISMTIDAGGDSGGFNFTYVKSTTTVTPTQLPNTGAEDITIVNLFPIFAIVSIVAGLWLRRKNATV